MPGFPSGATYPVATPVPGSPSGVSFPVQAPATPGFTSGMYPGQPAPSQPNWGVYPGMVPPQQPAPPPNKWIQPLPLWITLTSSIIGASVLAALMFFTGSDWAAGAQIAGIVALVLGLLVLTAFIARSMMGMLSATNARRTSQVVSAIVLTVLLFGYGSFAMFGQNSIHNLQGRALESQQQWQHAIDEYGRAGQTSPTSVDIARTYNEWGQHLLTQTPPDYQGALDKFNKVMSDFAALSDQVTQAQQGATSAYQNLGKQAAQQKHYDVAINQYYTALLNQSYCQNGTNCYTSTSSLEATAYFNLAEQHLSAQDYTDAADAFKHLTTDPNLKGSPEAKQAHGDYAKALLGEGKQALTTTCSSAVPIYQQLAQDFSDTPEGQQAQQALNGPAQVTGHFTSTVPAASDTPFVLLSKTQVTQATTFNQFMSIYQGSPHGPINSDGTFTLSVQPGSYQFTFGTLTNPDQVIRIIFHLNNTTIGPLCFSFGDITDAVPAQ